MQEIFIKFIVLFTSIKISKLYFLWQQFFSTPYNNKRLKNALYFLFSLHLSILSNFHYLEQKLEQKDKSYHISSNQL